MLVLGHSCSPGVLLVLEVRGETGAWAPLNLVADDSCRGITAVVTVEPKLLSHPLPPEPEAHCWSSPLVQVGWSCWLPGYCQLLL